MTLPTFITRSDAAYEVRANLFNAKKAKLLMLATLIVDEKARTDCMYSDAQSSCVDAFLHEYSDTAISEFELARCDYDSADAIEAESALYAAAKQLALAIVNASIEVD